MWTSVDQCGPVQTILDKLITLDQFRPSHFLDFKLGIPFVSFFKLRKKNRGRNWGKKLVKTLDEFVIALFNVIGVVIFIWPFFPKSQFGHDWSILDHFRHFQRVWTSLNKFQPLPCTLLSELSSLISQCFSVSVWTSLDNFRQYQTILDKFGQVQTSLDKFRPLPCSTSSELSSLLAFSFSISASVSPAFSGIMICSSFEIRAE